MLLGRERERKGGREGRGREGEREGEKERKGKKNKSWTNIICT